MKQQHLAASENHARRINATEVTPTRGEHFIFSAADGTAKLFGRDYGVRESTLRREQPVRSEHLTDETTDDAEARNDFWSMEGDFICRLHVEPRVQLCVPKEETFPIPLKNTLT